MMGAIVTPYHAAYYAYELTPRSPSDDVAKLGASLFSASVDLNPHQLDAALAIASQNSWFLDEEIDKLERRRQIKVLESTRSKKRHELYEAQDDIDTRKEVLISGLEARLKQSVEVHPLFVIQWRVT